MTLAQIKSHLAIDGTNDDTRLTALLNAAVDLCERETNRTYRATTYDVVLPTFPSEKQRLEFKKPPLASISSIAYYTSSGSTATLSSTAYYLMAPTNQVGWVEPKSAWPATDDRPDAVTIRYVTAGSSLAPPVVGHAVKLLVGHWNENREAEIAGTISSEIKIGLDRLLNYLKVGNVY